MIDLTGREKDLEIAATVMDTWEAGYDAILFKNYTTPGGKTGKSFILVKDPAQLRKKGAAFDKAKRHSAELMAGLALTAAMPRQNDR